MPVEITVSLSPETLAAIDRLGVAVSRLGDVAVPAMERLVATLLEARPGASIGEAANRVMSGFGPIGDVLDRPVAPAAPRVAPMPPPVAPRARPVAERARPIVDHQGSRMVVPWKTPERELELRRVHGLGMPILPTFETLNALPAPQQIPNPKAVNNWKLQLKLGRHNFGSTWRSADHIVGAGNMVSAPLDGEAAPPVAPIGEDPSRVAPVHSPGLDSGGKSGHPAPLPPPPPAPTRPPPAAAPMPRPDAAALRGDPPPSALRDVGGKGFGPGDRWTAARIEMARRDFGGVEFDQFLENLNGLPGLPLRAVWVRNYCRDVLGLTGPREAA